MKQQIEPVSDKHEPATCISQVNKMQCITHQKPQGVAPGNKWLRRACTTGFAFFLAKGLVWIAAAAWAIH